MPSNSRPIYEKSLEELLLSLESNEEASSVGLTDDVFSFLKYFNFTPGDHLICKTVFYRLYIKWSEFPLNRKQFGLKIGSYFESHAKGPRTYWKVNVDSLQVNEFLLKYIEKNTQDKTKYPGWRRHFEDFISFYNIKPGKSWVQPYVLKHLYDKWCFNRKRKSMFSEVQLFNFCKLYFDYKRNTTSRMQWFGVNEEFMNTIPKQTLTNLHQAWEKKNGKKQKRTGKVPGSKTRVKSKNKI